MPHLKGELKAEGLRLAIVVSRWNSDVTSSLERGARRALIAMGAADNEITTVEVPGAFEIPLALKALADSDTYDGLIALGCVVKGDTTHFEHVSEAAMKGIYEVGMEYGLPIGCGVLTTYTIEQAVARAQDDEHNKGSESALAVIEMIDLLNKI